MAQYTPIIKMWHALWLFSGALLLIFILNPLLRQGMFLDGVIYAAIAKNLSLDHGTIWQPFYSETLYPQFYEHPPLALYLESLLFRVLGEHIRAENIYSFFIILGQLTLLCWYWLKKEKLAFYHLVILLLIWVMVPLNTRVFTSNILESTLTLFTTSASLLLLLETKRKWIDAACLFLASLAIFLGLLSNGPTAFFPLVIPLIKTITHAPPRDWMTGLKKTGLLILNVMLILFIFYRMVPAAWQNTLGYLYSQLLPSIIGDRIPIYTGLKHLHIIVIYLRAISIVSIFSLTCLVSAAIIKQQPIWPSIKQRIANPKFLLFFYISLIASLPVGISHRQDFSYIGQCAPFITLACTNLCYQPCLIILNYCTIHRAYMNLIQILSAFIFILTVCMSTQSCSQYKRDELLLKDLHVLIPFLQHTAIISSTKLIYDQSITAAYLARLSMIGLEKGQDQPYYLALKNDAAPHGYYPVKIPLAYYALYKKM